MKKLLLILTLLIGMQSGSALAQDRLIHAEDVISKRIYEYLMEYRPERISSDITWLDSGRWLTEGHIMLDNVTELMNLIDQTIRQNRDSFLDHQKALELRAKFTVALASLPSIPIADETATFSGVHEKGMSALSQVFDHKYKDAASFKSALLNLKNEISSFRDICQHPLLGMRTDSVFIIREAQFYLELKLQFQKAFAEMLQEVIHEYNLSDVEVVQLIEDLGTGEGRFETLIYKLRLKLDFKPGFHKDFNLNVFDEVVGKINSSLNKLVNLTKMPLAWFDIRLDRTKPFQRVMIEEAIAEREGITDARARVQKVIDACLKR